MDNLQPKESSTKHVESLNGSEHENGPSLSQPASQKPTRLMVLFACYISVSAMIYNFDLGENTCRLQFVEQQS